MWRSFHEQVTDRLARAGIVLLVAPGNHDASAFPGFETERAVYAEQWRGRLAGVATADAEWLPLFYAAAVGKALVGRSCVTPRWRIRCGASTYRSS